MMSPLCPAIPMVSAIIPSYTDCFPLNLAHADAILVRLRRFYGAAEPPPGVAVFRIHHCRDWLSIRRRSTARTAEAFPSHPRSSPWDFFLLDRTMMPAI